MSDFQVTHYWQPDPDIAQAVIGDLETGGVSLVQITSPTTEQLLAEVLVELKAIKLHLLSITEEDI